MEGIEGRDGMHRLLLSLMAGLAALGAALAARAADTIVFSTPPTQPPDVTRRNFQPLVDYLSARVGARIELVPARSFLEYANKMRAGEYDMLFDGPHFIAWRIKHLDHTVLAKLPGRLRFYVVVREDVEVGRVADLVGKRVCGPASPNLATLSFVDEFPNPARQPIVVPVKSFRHALACLKKGKSVASVFRDKFWDKKVPDDAKKGLRVLAVIDKNVPDRGFSITKEVDEATRRKLREALVATSDTEIAAKVLASLGAARKGFVPATDAEYRGLDRLLRPVWGFHTD